MEGFSVRNLKYMRAFAEAWRDEQFVQQVIAQLPWGHHTRLLDKLKERATREWYLRAAIENGWSQNVLVHQIRARLHERQGKALTNFTRALPPEHSDLAKQILSHGLQASGFSLNCSQTGQTTFQVWLDGLETRVGDFVLIQPHL